MTKDEALQMCLEYIETNAHERRHVRWAIKVALAEPTSGDYALGYGEGFNDACKRQPEQDAAAFIAAEDRKVASRYGYVPKLHPSEWQVANPERPWVGLTGQEKAWIASVSLDVHDAVHRTDAKLKEKNT